MWIGRLPNVDRVASLCGTGGFLMWIGRLPNVDRVAS